MFRDIVLKKAWKSIPVTVTANILPPSASSKRFFMLNLPERILSARFNEAEKSVIDAQHSLLAAVINASNAKAQLEAAVYAFSDRKSEE